MSEERPIEKRSYYIQWFASIAATFGVISDGMHVGWASPALPILMGPESPIPVDEDEAHWIELLYMLGGIAGLPITVISVDRIGRQKSVLLAAAQNTIAWVLIATAKGLPQIYVARVLSGIASNVAFVAAPMYIAEVAQAKIRGALATSIYVSMITGVLIIYIITPYLPIWLSATIGALSATIQLASFPFMPESPYWLLMKNRKPKAYKALQVLRARDNVDEEMAEIELALQHMNSKKGRLVDLVREKNVRKGMIIMTVMNMAQHFSGITVLYMNLHHILSAAHASAGSAAIVFAGVMLLASVISSVLMDSFGRKILLISSSLCSAVTLYILATYFYVQDVALVDISSYSWITVVAVLSYALLYKTGLGMVPIVLTAEIFPTNVKAMCMTIADLIYVSWGSLSLQVYQLTLRRWGMCAPFFLFGTSCVLTALFVVCYVPETKGKTLDNIQDLLKGIKNKNDQSLKQATKDEA